MLRELVTASAIGLFMVGGAYAQSSTEVPTTTVPATPATPEPVQMVKKAEGHLATDLLGRTVYNGTSEESEAIGDVNDFTVGPDGQIQAVVIGVGGFLGLGEKNVAIEYGLVKFEDRNDSEVLVVETTAEKLDAPKIIKVDRNSRKSASAPPWLKSHFKHCLPRPRVLWRVAAAWIREHDKDQW